MSFDLKYVTIPFVIDDVSTAGQVVLPVNGQQGGKIVEIRTALNGAIGTADVDLTAKVNGVAVTGGVLTIATTSSAVGDVNSIAPTAANDVVEGDYIEIETDGASSNTVRVFGSILIQR